MQSEKLSQLPKYSRFRFVVSGQMLSSRAFTKISRNTYADDHGTVQSCASPDGVMVVRWLAGDLAPDRVDSEPD